MTVSEEKAKQEAAIQQKLAAMFAANSDNVSVPKIYIDMIGDFEAAAVLDELMFWTLPKKTTGKTSLRVFKKGALWLAVRRKDWWDRKRLTERQADNAISKLVRAGLAEKEVFLFDGKPTVHLRLNMTTFGRLYGEKMSELAAQEDDETLIRDIADLYEMMGFPNETVNSILPNGEMLNLPNGEFINSPVQPSNTTNGGKPPIDRKDLSVEWQMLDGKPIVLPDEKQAKRKDAAMLIGMGLGVLAEPAAALALAFQTARDITFTDGQVKGQRMAAKELLAQKVTPAIVTAAVKKLTEAGMTVTDLYSVTKTCIDLVNKAEAPKSGRSLPTIG